MVIFRHQDGNDLQMVHMSQLMSLLASLKSRIVHLSHTSLSPHSMTPTRPHPYVRHARFPRKDPREEVGVSVTFHDTDILVRILTDTSNMCDNS